MAANPFLAIEPGNAEQHLIKRILSRAGPEQERNGNDDLTLVRFIPRLPRLFPGGIGPIPQQSNPNVVEKEKGKQRRGIVKDERGQDQPATKEDAQLGSNRRQRRPGLEAIWWV
jgi:hypothetical protein